MFRFLTACLAFFTFAPTVVLAGDAAQPGHSTVHLVFIAPNPHQSQPMGGVGLGGAQTPSVKVGNMIGSANQIRLIRIKLDGEFVSHAMVGMFDIEPVLVLPEGQHKMTFTVDGFDPVAADIKVLGTNSKQYLVVELPAEKPESKTSAVSAEASAVQLSDD